MSNNTTVDIIIPDIGDSEDVEIIEILISVGDSVNADDSLLTLESDKASMEVPSASAGVIETLTISVGDIVNAGDVIGTMSASSGSDSAATADSKPDSAPAQAQTAEESITQMEEFRKQLKSEAREDDPKITGLAFHMKALANTLKAFPKLNSSMSADGQALLYKKYCHIGIAVDTPNGLVVPVFRDVDKKSINQLAIEMSDVSTRARSKKLKPDEMQGASMTISSLGGIGGTQFTPIVNPPEVAIMGITRASMQPVWNGSEFIPRLMCPLDLTYDHRVVDGADAARFMAYYVKQISDIRRLTL